MSYVVTVEGPRSAWVRWNRNTGLPCFTFVRPDGISLAEARELKSRADICCGGTLRVAKACS